MQLAIKGVKLYYNYVVHFSQKTVRKELQWC